MAKKDRNPARILKAMFPGARFTEGMDELEQYLDEQVTLEQIRDHAGTYSPDVEIDHVGTLRWARDVPTGQLVEVPMHLMRHLHHG